MARYALVVDDTHVAATTIAQALNLLGYQVQVAYSPRAAIESLFKRMPDVIVLDINMPGMMAWRSAVTSATTHERKKSHHRHVFQAQEEMGQVRGGPNDFLAKPWMLTFWSAPERHPQTRLKQTPHIAQCDTDSLCMSVMTQYLALRMLTARK
jgi:CheY-like chemotaxis protein